MDILDELWNKRHPHYMFFLELMKDSERDEDDLFITYERNNKILIKYNKKTEYTRINYFIFYFQFKYKFELSSYKEYNAIINNIIKTYLNINGYSR